MKNYAVIETGGKQYCVSDNTIIDIEISPECKEGENIDFDKVLLFDDGVKTDVGMPYLAGKKVTGCLLYTSPSPRD